MLCLSRLNVSALALPQEWLVSARVSSSTTRWTISRRRALLTFLAYQRHLPISSSPVNDPCHPWPHSSSPTPRMTVSGWSLAPQAAHRSSRQLCRLVSARCHHEPYLFNALTSINYTYTIQKPSIPNAFYNSHNYHTIDVHCR